MRAPLAILICIAAPLFAQPEPPKKTPPEPAPPEAVLLDLRSAYSKPTAEEVTVKFRSAAATGTAERSDSFIVRIDPGEPGTHQPRSMLLDLGALRIHFAAGKLTAINSSAPDKVFTRTYTEPLTPARLAELLPPLPVPQLALASNADLNLRSPIALLTDITWDKGIWDDLARPPIVSMKGSGITGTAEIQVGVQSRRLTKFIATIRRAGLEGTYELSFHPIDPGDPAKWVIPLEGRQPVPQLVDLKPPNRPLAIIELGQPVPNISLSRFDLTGWQLHEALEAAKPNPLALILFRADKQQSHMVEARIGLAALRSLHAKSAAAVTIDLPDFSRDRWKDLRQAWNPQPDPDPIGADELMWSSGATQSLDRFTPSAAAILIIRPDKTLLAVINLEGRADKPDEITAELRRALTSLPAPPP